MSNTTAAAAEPVAHERDLVQQAKTRLRRIEGQVRGIQGMLDRLDEEPAVREALSRQVRELLAEGKRESQVARELSLSRPRLAELASGAAPEGEPCDSLLTQILAVHAAVEQVGLMIMELHLQHCVLEGMPMDEQRWRDLRDLLKLWSRLGSS